MQGRLTEQSRNAGMIVPQDVNGTATTTAWVNTQDYVRIQFVILQGAWAGGTPAVTLLQAPVSSGAGSKALAFDTYYQSTLTSDVPTVTAVISNTFNLPNQANTVTMIEVHTQDLDTTNGFKFVQLAIASPGSHSDLLAATAILYEPGWAGLPTTGRTVLS